MAAVHHHHCDCAHTELPKKPLSERLFRALEKVSAIALGIFAAYASFELFLSFFAAGAAVGLYQHFSATPQEGVSHGSSCSQGFLEQLTQVKLPPLLSLGVNLAVTWCHIDHHTTVFVPIIGLSMGAWAGKSLGDLSGKICPVQRAATA